MIWLRNRTHSRAPVRIALAALATLATLASAGCGYSSHLALDHNVQTIGIEIFGNDTRERDVERDLHGELSRAVRNLVDANIATPSRADAVIRGKLIRFGRFGGIRSPDNELLQTGLSIQTRVTLTDRRTGEDLAGPLEIGVDLGFSITGVGMEAEARRRALRNLAERITLDLFTAAALRRDEALEEERKKALNQ